MKLHYTHFVAFLSIILLMGACSDRRKVTRTDTPTSGEAMIVADDCLAPIVYEEINAFTGTNPEASIEAIYTNEREVFDLLVSDSIRLAITTRPLSDSEKATIKNNKLRIRSQVIAIDGIALITNKSNRDTLMSIPQLKRILSGEITQWKELNHNSTLGAIDMVFDSPNSSTVRFINDSLTAGKAFAQSIHVIGQDTITTSRRDAANLRVIDYVKEHPNAIGIIGVNWISSQNDTANLGFIDKINVIGLTRKNEIVADSCYQPYAYHLALGNYPLTRNVYMILTDVSGGLPSGLAAFIAGERGQRIILKAGLRPATVPTRVINVRPTLLKEE